MQPYFCFYVEPPIERGLVLCSLRRHLLTLLAASEVPGAPEGASWGLVPGWGGEGMDGAWSASL